MVTQREQIIWMFLECLLGKIIYLKNTNMLNVKSDVEEIYNFHWETWLSITSTEHFYIILCGRYQTIESKILLNVLKSNWTGVVVKKTTTRTNNGSKLKNCVVRRIKKICHLFILTQNDKEDCPSVNVTTGYETKNLSLVHIHD